MATKMAFKAIIFVSISCLIRDTRTQCPFAPLSVTSSSFASIPSTFRSLQHSVGFQNLGNGGYGITNQGIGFFEEGAVVPGSRGNAALGSGILRDYLAEETYRARLQGSNAQNFLASGGNQVIPRVALDECLAHGHRLTREQGFRTNSIFQAGFIPELGTAEMGHYYNMKASDRGINIASDSHAQILAARALQQSFCPRLGLTPNSLMQFLMSHGYKLPLPAQFCVRDDPVLCTNRDFTFRTIDGSCNNLKHTTWGMAHTSLNRLLPPRYADGLHMPPLSVTGGPLPNARLLSEILFPDVCVDDPSITMYGKMWAQLLAHDLALTTMIQTADNGITCCTSDNSDELLPEWRHHACLPIRIRPQDSFYSQFNARCMNFVRAMTSPMEDCRFAPAQQMNSATAWLDASFVYGSDLSVSYALREGYGGRLLTVVRRGREMLPPRINNITRSCDVDSPNEPCYRAGDVRVNVNPHLAVLHTVFVREHNKIAGILSRMNPHWNEERVYQEVRRIVIAQFQHITYHEWLPLYLGGEYMQNSGREAHRDHLGYSHDYNSEVNSATMNVFTTGSFRFVHTLMQGTLRLFQQNGQLMSVVRLSDTFNKPAFIEQGINFDGLVASLLNEPQQTADTYFTVELTNFLFKSKKAFGMDLESLDIARGRDHGLASYIDYRAVCGLRVPQTFHDLQGIMANEHIRNLESLYASIQDVDLFVGMMLEFLVEGSQFSPVALCIIGEQFYRSRIGDRYFYDSATNPNPFTPDQLAEIRKATASRLLCNNGDDIHYVQPLGMLQPSPRNQLVSCYEGIPKINLEPWRERRY